MSYAIMSCNHCASGNPVRELLSTLQERACEDDFTPKPINCLAGCARPLAVAFSSPDKASYLFGNIESVRDVDALLKFGALYRQLADGWGSASQRPPALRGKTIARIPFFSESGERQ